MNYEIDWDKIGEYLFMATMMIIFGVLPLYYIYIRPRVRRWKEVQKKKEAAIPIGGGLFSPFFKSKVWKCKYCGGKLVEKPGFASVVSAHHRDRVIQHKDLVCAECGNVQATFREPEPNGEYQHQKLIDRVREAKGVPVKELKAARLQQKINNALGIGGGTKKNK